MDYGRIQCDAEPVIYVLAASAEALLRGGRYFPAVLHPTGSYPTIY